MVMQIIPDGGFASQTGNGKGTTTYKSLKTLDLKEVRHEEIKQLDDEPQFVLSKHMLDQFNQIKKILVNFGFRNKGKIILCTEIINDTMDEMRCERKIMMVLENRKVKEYINANMTELDLYNQDILKQQMIDLGLDDEIKYMIQEKIRWRNNYAQDLSILKLDYIFRVLRVMYKNKAQIADPDAFKYKIKAMMKAQRRAKRQKLNRSDSQSSFASMYSKSQKTGITDGSASGKSSNAGSSALNSEDEDGGDDDDQMTFATEAVNNDPVMLAFTQLFEGFQESIETIAEQKIYAQEVQQRVNKRANPKEESNGFKRL